MTFRLPGGGGAASRSGGIRLEPKTVFTSWQESPKERRKLTSEVLPQLRWRRYMPVVGYATAALRSLQSLFAAGSGLFAFLPRRRIVQFVGDFADSFGIIADTPR